MYCLPDFEPVIELAVNGMRNMGLMMDNRDWLDVTTLIIQAVLTNTSPACNGWSVVDFSVDSGGLMGSNETVIVGVDSNHFAKTDGWNIEIYSQTDIKSLPSAFRSRVNLEYCLAIVSVTADIQGLLGCMCTDQDYGMQIIVLWLRWICFHQLTMFQ